MKKKLLMAAVGAALVAGPMLASAAGTTLYGRFHMSLDRLDNDAGRENGYISSNTSRLGIKGDEDLGGGLKAIYQMETAFTADEGGGTLAGRNTFVGFAGDWGTFKAGRHDTPYKELGNRTNRFIEQVGDARNMYGTGSICDVSAAVTSTTTGTYTACDSRAGFDARPDNMLRYDSPAFGGAKVSVMYSPNNVDSAATGGSGDDAGAGGRALTSLGVNWQGGPLFLGAAYETHQKLTTGATGETDKEKGLRLVGDYAFGDLTLGLLYEMVNDIDGVSDLDRTVVGIAAAFKMGNNTFKAHWFDSGDLDCPAGSSCAGTDTNMIAIGVDHMFSKNTQVYLNWAKAEGGDNMVVDVANSYTGHGESNAGAVQTGKAITGISAGVMVAF